MATFNGFKDFTTAPAKYPVETFWGGGHTPDTEPTQRGWRCVPVKGPTPADPVVCWVVGQRGVKGCASLMMADGRLDVALYEEGPKEVDASLRKLEGSTHVDAQKYLEFQAIPGVGLRVIREILAERASQARWEANKS
jgi:hypothetical protein